MLQARAIRRGELDRSITFIEEVTTRGASNQDKITSWQEIAENPTVFARRKELSGNEFVINDQLTFVQKTEFIIVYREDLSVRNRIVFNNKVYEIISIVETEQRQSYLQILANYLDKEPVPSGVGEFDEEEFADDFNVG